MPDDYQTLGEELQAQSALSTQGKVDSDPNNEPDKTNPDQNLNADPAKAVDKTPATDPAKEDNEQDSIPASDTDDKSNQAFAKLRASNTRYEKIFQKIQEAEGFTNVDEVLDKLENDAYEKIGKNQNSDPELLKRIATLEANNAVAVQHAQEQALLLGLKSVQDEFKLDDPSVKTFVQDAMKAGIDLLTNSIDLKVIYRSIYHDKLTNAAIETARQEWIKQGSKADNASDVDDSKGKSKDTSTKIETMAQLDSVLNEFSSNNK